MFWKLNLLGKIIQFYEECFSMNNIYINYTLFYIMWLFTKDTIHSTMTNKTFPKMISSDALEKSN